MMRRCLNACCGIVGFLFLMCVPVAFMLGCDSRIRVEGASQEMMQRHEQTAPTVTNSVTKTKAPDGTESVTTSTSTTGEHVKSEATAAAKGPSGDASGDKANLKSGGELPKQTLPPFARGGSGASSDGASFFSTAFAAAGGREWWLIIGGIVCIVVGVAAFYLQRRRAGFAFGGLGLALVGAGFFPDIAMAVIVGGLVVGGVVYWISERSAHTAEGVGRALVDAIANSTDAARAEVKSRIKDPTGKVDLTITRLKRKVGIRKPQGG